MKKDTSGGIYGNPPVGNWEKEKHTPDQWVRDYNAKGYTSSAGKALSQAMRCLDECKKENAELLEALRAVQRELNLDGTTVEKLVCDAINKATL